MFFLHQIPLDVVCVVCADILERGAESNHIAVVFYMAGVACHPNQFFCIGKVERDIKGGCGMGKERGFLLPVCGKCCQDAFFGHVQDNGRVALFTRFGLYSHRRRKHDVFSWRVPLFRYSHRLLFKISFFFQVILDHLVDERRDCPALPRRRTGEGFSNFPLHPHAEGNVFFHRNVNPLMLKFLKIEGVC